jgi:hypothetical protein
VALAHVVGRALRRQALDGVLADALEHAEAGLLREIRRVVGAQERLVAQRLQQVEGPGCVLVVEAEHGLRRLEVEAAVKTEHCMSACRSALVSRSQDQSRALLSVAWRGRASRGPPLSTSKRRESRSLSCRGFSTRMRAAASSMASGKPSRLRTMSAMTSSSPSAGVKLGLATRARSRKSATASDDAASAAEPGTASGSTASVCSAGRRKSSREVTRKHTSGALVSQRPTVWGPSATTCSKLSRMSSSAPRPAKTRPMAATLSSPATSGTPRTLATAVAMPSTLRASVRSHRYAPPPPSERRRTQVSA